MSENRGKEITDRIIEGEDAKLVTAKMAKPGAKRQEINLANLEANPNFIESQHKYRPRFIQRGNLWQF